MSDVVRFESRRVGPIEVADSDILTFEPLPGFANKTRFVLVEHAEGSEMAWLVSLDDPDLAFVVTTPWNFFPTYDPPVSRENLAALGIEKREEVELFNIVTLAGKTIYLNLSAPLLINVKTRKGLQVVSDDQRYTTRAPIPSLKADARQETDKDSRRESAPSTAAAKSAPAAP